ncbi:MAG: hypothetical protein ACXV8O_21760, partial [Methylobacter sp.]
AISRRRHCAGTGWKEAPGIGGDGLMLDPIMYFQKYAQSAVAGRDFAVHLVMPIERMPSHQTL